VTPLVEVRNLVKEFRVAGGAVVHAVNDVSFSVERGKTLGLVGESGSGKTTVGRCILRTVEPTSGSILFDGQNLVELRGRELRRRRRYIQIVFQDPFDALDPRMVVADIIREPLRAQPDVPRSQELRRMREVAAAVGLPRTLLGHFARELSAGQQQRVGIARAIASRPRVIVLDEAVSNVDPSTRFELIELLNDLQRQLGLTYIFISHDLNTVRYISDHVAIMYLGKIVEFGTAEEIFDNQLHPYSRALLSAVLAPDPSIKRPPYTLRGEIPSPTKLPSGCFLHPRCPEAVPACQLAYPPMIESTPGHAGSCFWNDPSTFPSAGCDDDAAVSASLESEVLN
jgi:oligopeptide/dipeptide ABC transporter ATP-binding protein